MRLGHHRISVSLTAFAILLALATAPALFAQGGRASISGLVSDPSGAAVPGVSVTATNAATRFTTTATTTDIGTYVMPLLPLGTYDVSVKKEGFKTETRTGIMLTADLAATVNLTMTVGSVTEEVKVSADAEMIATTTARTIWRGRAGWRAGAISPTPATPVSRAAFMPRTRSRGLLTVPFCGTAGTARPWRAAGRCLSSRTGIWTLS